MADRLEEELPEPDCPGTTITGRMIVPPTGGRQVELEPFPGLFTGGLQGGVLGVESGKEEGGPQEGVFGEIGANPGSFESEEAGGGPQEGVSGEMGANPGSSFEAVSEVSGT